MDIETFKRMANVEFRAKSVFRDFSSNNKDFLKAMEIADILNVSKTDYLKGVFADTWGEKHYRRIYFPRMLSSKWAIYKVGDYVLLKNDKKLSQINMEKSWIDRTAVELAKDPMYFKRENGLIPYCLDDMRKWNMCWSYCVCHPEFKIMMKNLDIDIKHAYFDMENLNTISQMIHRNRELKRYIEKRI